MSVFDLTGRKALVTGGAQGLGEGMARALARAGASVVIADIREDVGKACADSLRSDGAKAEFVPLDITAEESWVQAIPQVIAHLFCVPLRTVQQALCPVRCRFTRLFGKLPAVFALNRAQ